MATGLACAVYLLAAAMSAKGETGPMCYLTRLDSATPLTMKSDISRAQKDTTFHTRNHKKQLESVQKI